jgi:hypothetical protein
MFRPTCTDLWAPFLFSPQGLRVRPAPGIPCALFFMWDEDDASPGRKRAAGMLNHVFIVVPGQASALRRVSAVK